LFCFVFFCFVLFVLFCFVLFCLFCFVTLLQSTASFLQLQLRQKGRKVVSFKNCRLQGPCEG
jgi:hypothetical protein